MFLNCNLNERNSEHPLHKDFSVCTCNEINQPRMLVNVYTRFLFNRLYLSKFAALLPGNVFINN